ncbi:MAG: protease inhibitor I42 family protein [bacterium]
MQSTTRYLLVAVFLTAVVMSGCCPFACKDPAPVPASLDPIRFDEQNHGDTVTMAPGQVLLITLESNGTTGYQWQQLEVDETILKLAASEYVVPDTGDPPRVGAGGHEIFRYEAISAGETSLELGYRRPRETGEAPARTFNLSVTVRD